MAKKKAKSKFASGTIVTPEYREALETMRRVAKNRVKREEQEKEKEVKASEPKPASTKRGNRTTKKTNNDENA